MQEPPDSHDRGDDREKLNSMPIPRLWDSLLPSRTPGFAISQEEFTKSNSHALQTYKPGLDCESDSLSDACQHQQSFPLSSTPDHKIIH